MKQDEYLDPLLTKCHSTRFTSCLYQVCVVQFPVIGSLLYGYIYVSHSLEKKYHNNTMNRMIQIYTDGDIAASLLYMRHVHH